MARQNQTSLTCDVTADNEIPFRSPQAQLAAPCLSGLCVDHSSPLPTLPHTGHHWICQLCSSEACLDVLS